jgi:hypothetical protein
MVELASNQRLAICRVQGGSMKALFPLGLVLLVIGVLSLFIAVPHSERHGVSVGGASVGIETHHSDKVAPIVSAVLILGGVGLAVAGKFRTA